MTLFLSLVGFQPSAVAVALATWAKTRGLPEATLLLATSETRTIAERLKRWAWDRFKLKAEIEMVSTSLEGGGESPPAADVVRRRLLPQEIEQVVFYADPGLKAVVVAIARQLPAGAIFLHSDDSHLHVRRMDGQAERWDSSPLQNLHLKALLSLYGLEVTKGSKAHPMLPPAVERALQDAADASRFRRAFAIEDAGEVVADLGWEAQGRLYMLFVVEGANGLERVRELERLPIQLRRLQPRTAVWSRSRTTLYHARAARLLGIDAGTAHGQSVLRSWLLGGRPAPGHVLADAPAWGSAEIASWHRDAAVEGPSLVVCLGADPAATLISLATHRPRRAWVLYDAATPLIAYRARMLRSQLEYLPVGEAHFVATDLYGRDIGVWGRTTAIESARVDITPGSKGQACALARLDRSQLWSLHGTLGTAAPLFGDGRSLRLQGPGLRVAGSVIGGPLEDPGDDAKAVQPQRAQFLEQIMAFLRCFLTSRGEAAHLGRIGRPRRCQHGGEMTTRQAGSDHVAVHVTHRGRAANGQLASAGGFWFEAVVAHAFVGAGADEVRLNMRWAWPREIVDHLRKSGTLRPGERVHRRELDVAARFGHQVVCVSCKTGNPDPDRLEVQRREIEAVAAGSFGRMAVPILVLPNPAAELVAASRRDPRRAIVLGLADIVSGEDLRGALESVFRKRSTLGNE